MNALKAPPPDAASFIRTLKEKTQTPNKVHSFEFTIAHLPEIFEKYIGGKWVDFQGYKGDNKTYWKNTVETLCFLGYDIFPAIIGLDFKEAPEDDPLNVPVSSWEDFEKYPWPSLKGEVIENLEYISGILPDGMEMFITPTAGFFGTPRNKIMGYEGMSLLMFDQPDLAMAVFEKVQNIILDSYKKLLGLPKLTGFFQCDDMGFKTATMISPESMRRYVFPGHKKAAELAHANNLVYCLHACGNLEAVTEELINDVKIDAKHSYEDSIIPVTEFKKKYGDKIAVIGGVDMDKLCRLPEGDLRKYLRNILDSCVPGGGYIFGSGNSIASYVPFENYMIMLDEAYNYL